MTSFRPLLLKFGLTPRHFWWTLFILTYPSMGISCCLSFKLGWCIHWLYLYKLIYVVNLFSAHSKIQYPYLKRIFHHANNAQPLKQTTQTLKAFWTTPASAKDLGTARNLCSLKPYKELKTQRKFILQTIRGVAFSGQILVKCVLNQWTKFLNSTPTMSLKMWRWKRAQMKKIRSIRVL